MKVTQPVFTRRSSSSLSAKSTGRTDSSRKPLSRSVDSSTISRVRKSPATAANKEAGCGGLLGMWQRAEQRGERESTIRAPHIKTPVVPTHLLHLDTAGNVERI